jgi:cell division protease FtsH
MVARALANEAAMEMVAISSSDIVSKYQGDSAKAVRDLFDTARMSAPCIVFIDEIDR